MSNQPNKPNGLMIESKSVSKADNYLRTKHDHSESSTSELSFLMSSLKRDCREVFVRIATHVGHMVLCCTPNIISELDI